MPLYEYKCHSCGKTFEVIQKFADEPLKTHAECGGEVERLLSAPAFHLKGTGWYATDYGKGNGGKHKASEEKEGKSEKDGKGDKSEKADHADAKSDSKPKTETSSSGGSESKPSGDSKPSAAPASSSESK